VLYFAGGATRWSRNLRENPGAEVHLESTQRVVILEGEVERVLANAHGMEEVNEAGRGTTATSTKDIDGRSGRASPSHGQISLPMRLAGDSSWDGFSFSLTISAGR
jgi:hypothetical protein